MNKELIATILREVCETDPADATLPTTVCINVDVLGRIVDQALAQQEQPASVDAYVGAREDAAIWKKRALEAEELNRKFIAELNGPTYLGEPVKQDQPAQEPCGYLDEFGNFENMLLAWTRMKEEPGVAWAPVYKRPAPAQPAMTYSDLEACREVADKTFCHHKSSIRGQQLCDADDYEWHLAKAIEAHCRGGVGK